MNNIRKKEMTKKAWKELQKISRGVSGFNTGTRTMKSAKDYNRQKAKKEVRDVRI